MRSVWIEVKLAEASTLLRAGRCKEALGIANHLEAPVAGMAFTENGLKEIAESPRTNYLLAEVDATCGQESDADRRYEATSHATDPARIIWAMSAARKRSGYDAEIWRGKLTSALTQAESRVRTSSFKGWWTYSVGVLQIALGHEEEGKASLREALLLPDILMSHHFARVALADATPR